MPADEDACIICEGDKSTTKNPIIFCDGKDCNIPVHKRCYNVQTVPKGEWFCERCEAKRNKKSINVVCCSTQTGAIKKTKLTGEYMHVVCALWNKSIKHENDPYSIPESQIGTHECYFCSQKQGLCIKCDQPNCSIYFHVTCAINNSIISPSPAVPSNFSPRCVQHQIKTNHTKKTKRRLRPSRLFDSDEEDSESEQEESEESEQEPEPEKEVTKPKMIKKPPTTLFGDTDDSEDDMGTKEKLLPIKRRVSADKLSDDDDDDDDDMGTKKPKFIKTESVSLSYKERLEAKRKKSGLESSRPFVVTPPLPNKQKLPNKTHLNTNNGINRQSITPPIKKFNHTIKDIDEIQNDIRTSQQRWNNSQLQHPQPTTPQSINPLFFENEIMRGPRKSIDASGMEEVYRLRESLREETRKFNEFKKIVSEVFQGLNTPIQGVDPTNNIELYITQLQSLLKRVGPIREEERTQIDSIVKDTMMKRKYPNI